MDFKQAIDIIVEQVISVVRTLVEDAPFDRTYTGTVVSNLKETNSSLYSIGVLIDGKTRMIRTPLNLTVGMNIKVLIPRNNWNNATILLTDTLYVFLINKLKEELAQEESGDDSQEGGENVDG